MSHQTGTIYRKGNAWMGKWWEDALVNGRVARRRRARKLAEFGDRFRTEKDVRPLLAEILVPLNSGKASPQSTMTVAEYWEGYFLPYVKTELKPSTAHGYEQIWRMYLGPRLQKAVLRDLRCVDATNVLASIHREHGIGRKTLNHCKGLLRSIFSHAKRSGVLDGANPIEDAGIPKKAAASKSTHAATVEEVTVMLAVLTGQARVAVALMFFAGLRPGEARGLQWEDYSGETLSVRRSVWEKFETAPKTETSVAEVSIPEILQSILEEHRRTSNGSAYILANGSGKPLDLQNLANRAIRPVLRKANIPWHGYYALRRGHGTFAAGLSVKDAADSLRNNIATAAKHYVKRTPNRKVADEFDKHFPVAQDFGETPAPTTVN